MRHAVASGIAHSAFFIQHSPPMTLLLSITVGVVMAAAIYLLLSKELKAVAMGVFLLSHAANLAIITVSRNPLGKRPPVLGSGGQALGGEVDPLPQALILTAIVIGFAVQAFLLTLLVVTWRRGRSLDLKKLAATPAPVEILLRSHDPRLLRLSEDEHDVIDDVLTGADREVARGRNVPRGRFEQVPVGDDRHAGPYGGSRRPDGDGDSTTEQEATRK